MVDKRSSRRGFHVLDVIRLAAIRFFHRRCQCGVCEHCRASEVPMPVFGMPLEHHLAMNGETIAVPIYQCCEHLKYTGAISGIFRCGASLIKVNELKRAFNEGDGQFTILQMQEFPHVIAAVLKAYLRELPDPLLTKRLASKWEKAVKHRSLSKQLKSIQKLLAKLPRANFDNLRYLIHFFVEMLTHEETTEIDIINLSIVMGPNIINTDIPSAFETGKKLMSLFLTYSKLLFNLESNKVDFELDDEVYVCHPHVCVSRASSLEMVPEESESVLEEQDIDPQEPEVEAELEEDPEDELEPWRAEKYDGFENMPDFVYDDDE